MGWGRGGFCGRGGGICRDGLRSLGVYRHPPMNCKTRLPEMEVAMQLFPYDDLDDEDLDDGREPM